MEDLGDIDIASEASKEIPTKNHVVEVDVEEQFCTECVTKVLSAPSFKKHSIHGKKSIHIHVRLQGITSIALIDYGARNNFTNMDECTWDTGNIRCALKTILID